MRSNRDVGFMFYVIYVTNWKKEILKYSAICLLNKNSFAIISIQKSFNKFIKMSHLSVFIPLCFYSSLFFSTCNILKRIWNADDSIKMRPHVSASVKRVKDKTRGIRFFIVSSFHLMVGCFCNLLIHTLYQVSGKVRELSEILIYKFQTLEGILK